jgi:hypothetical protein
MSGMTITSITSFKPEYYIDELKLNYIIASIFHQFLALAHTDSVNRPSCIDTHTGTPCSGARQDTDTRSWTTDSTCPDTRCGHAYCSSPCYTSITDWCRRATQSSIRCRHQ